MEERLSEREELRFLHHDSFHSKTSNVLMGYEFKILSNGT